MTDRTPTVLFVCVHNAGRSQMAAGWLRELAGDRVEVRSAGSMPADQINSVAVEAMREEGIDIASEQPKVLTTEAVKESDVVITMGCGDACPIFPGKRYEDWQLDDPAGQGIDAIPYHAGMDAELRAAAQLILQDVIDDFVESYARGETPNPCVRCNERIKFASLLERATALGFDAVCTGHYASIRADGPGGAPRGLVVRGTR